MNKNRIKLSDFGMKPIDIFIYITILLIGISIGVIITLWKY